MLLIKRLRRCKSFTRTHDCGSFPSNAVSSSLIIKKEQFFVVHMIARTMMAENKALYELFFFLHGELPVTFYIIKRIKAKCMLEIGKKGIRSTIALSSLKRTDRARKG